MVYFEKIVQQVIVRIPITWIDSSSFFNRIGEAVSIGILDQRVARDFPLDAFSVRERHGHKPTSLLFVVR